LRAAVAVSSLVAPRRGESRGERGRKCGKTVTFIMKLGKAELRQADARSISVREWPTHKNKV